MMREMQKRDSSGNFSFRGSDLYKHGNYEDLIGTPRSSVTRDVRSCRCLPEDGIVDRK